jgi:hypothetical protein
MSTPLHPGDEPSPADQPQPRLFAKQGCPPVETRFRPGVSGNPKGRPKGARSLAELMDEEMKRKVTVTIDGQQRRLTKREILVRRLVDNAIKGNANALRTCASIEAANEARKKQVQAPAVDAVEVNEQDDEILRAMIDRASSQSTPGDSDDEPR